MVTVKKVSNLYTEIKDFTKRGFSPAFDRLQEKIVSDPVWHRLRETGTELWLDTGSIDDTKTLWTKEFSALTVNNTLLNKEIQTGRYDETISEAASTLDAYPQLDPQEKILEAAFILNAKHGLKLVENFDAFVSVEEHTDLAHDVERAVQYARRFYEICPERFIIKIPFSAAGLLATRRLSKEGIPVNHTLGFSARQNYLIARIGRPAYLNVFLGRLNSFVADNQLGDGSYVGEKAVLASQRVIRELRSVHKLATRQIGASLRSGDQIRDLAGMDIMTMPPKAAGEFLSMDITPEDITDRTSENYIPGLYEDTDPEALRLDTLWNVEQKLMNCADALENENLDSFTPDDLIRFLADHDCADILVKWSDSQIRKSTEEGKIPALSNWKDELASGTIGLDTLMNLAGLNSFATDQKAMDERVREIWSRTG